jgi:hypothetical protein
MLVKIFLNLLDSILVCVFVLIGTKSGNKCVLCNSIGVSFIEFSDFLWELDLLNELLFGSYLKCFLCGSLKDKC